MYRIILSTFFSLLAVQLLAQFGTPKEITDNFSKKQIPVDFDLDGDIDLVGANENLFLFENDGTGNFEKKALTSSWRFDESNQILITQDLNNDNYPDILYLNQYIGLVVAFKNNGDGTVTEIEVPITNSDIYLSRLIDLDSDGDFDLVGSLSSTNSSVAVFKNEGNFSFNTTPTLLSFSRPFRGFADVNLDGHDDIIFGGNGVQIKYNDGEGNFVDSTDIISVYSPSSQEPKPLDLENDGDIDLIWKGGNNLYVIENMGNGQFTIVQQSAAPSTSNNFVIVDLNYDGFQDLLVSSGFSYYQGYKLNDGSGNFGANINFNFSYSEVLGNNNYEYYAAKDFDGNGFVDILIAGQILFKSSAPLTFDPGIKICAHQDGLSMILMDADNDGIEDFVHAIKNNLVFHPGNPDGTFEQDYTIMGYLNGYTGQMYKLAVADINNDNLPDLFYHLPVQNQNPAIGFFVNQGNGTFNNLAVGSFSNIGLIQMTDLDNDGYSDVVYSGTNSVRWLKNNGNLSFAAPQLLYQGIPTANYWFQTGDVNNDSNEDLLVMQKTNSPYTYEIFHITGDGNGAFTGSPGTIVPVTSGISSRPIFSDINDDGNLDLIYEYSDVISYDTDRTPVMLGDGNGTFNLVSSPKGIFTNECKIVDINNDGLKDLVSRQNNNSFGIHFQLENTEFSDIVQFGELMGIPTDNFLITDNKDLIISGGSYDGYFLLENNFSNMLTAKAFIDLDSDGLLNGLDPGLPGASAYLNPSDSYHFSNYQGNIVACPITDGTNELNAPVVDYFNLTTNNTPYAFDNDPAADSVYHVEFGYAPTGNVEELEVNIIGSFPRCNTQINNWISIENTGSSIPSGIVKYELDSTQTFVSAGFAYDSIVGNTIYWHYDSLNYFESMLVNVIVQMPDFNSMGDTMTNVLTVSSTDNAQVYSDTLSQVLMCAYDPNDKTVTPQGIGENGYIPVSTEWLEYLVRFQNTGTDTAINIAIHDYLSHNLDWSSFTLLSSSHNVNTNIDSDGRAIFSFPSIHLPDSSTNELGSHGYLLYKIKVNPGLVNNNVISNTANIFFDYNPAVITNSTINTIYDCNQLFGAINPPASICINSEISASVDDLISNANCSWTLNGQTMLEGDVFSFTADEDGINELLLEVSTDFCSMDSLFEFSVYNYPVISMGVFTEDTVCIYAGDIGLPVVTPLGGSWTGSGLNGSVIEVATLTAAPYNYVYEVTENGCVSQDSVTLTVSECLGIEELNDAGIEVSPNPFDHSFTIQSETPLKNVQVIDLNGRSIYFISQKENVLTIELSEVKSGLYLLQVENIDSEVSTVRVVKK